MQVADLATGAVLFDQDGQKPAVTASTTKLLTAVAALDRLGPQTRLQTRVFAAGDVLYLVGAGDPTLSRDGTPPIGGAVAGAAPARIDDLARQVRAAGVRRVSAVVSDAGLFTGPPAAPGWSPAYFTAEIAPVSALSVDAGRAHPSVLPLPRTGDPAGQARSALAGALRATGVPVGTTRGGHLPPGARQVAVVQSPPVSDLVRRMLSWSDNDLAEALGRLTARAAGQPADFGGAARAVTAGLVTLGLPVAGLHLVDTSGLSHDDRVPPALLVATLRLASDPARPQLSAVLAGLPVAGRTGTLAHRFHDPQTRGAVGRVDAKTGRLAGMAALAGTVRTKDGRVLVFAVRAPSVDLTVGERAMDRIAATLASCGCRAGRT
jgi:D-alanyl-D-alanine carboxypeptidase/D-alanyl-D-alanine-endopeptidase (penicillin-binding protein 4)